MPLFLIKAMREVKEKKTKQKKKLKKLEKFHVKCDDEAYNI